MSARPFFKASKALPILAAMICASLAHAEPKHFELEGGYAFYPNGDTGSAFGGSAGTELESGHTHGGPYEHGFYLNPEIKVHLDYEGKDPVGNPIRQRLELGGITFFKVKLKEQAPVLTDPNLAHDTTGKITYQGMVACDSLAKAPSSCFEGLPAELSSWSESDKEVFQSRKVQSYRYQSKPSATGEILLANITAVYQRNPALSVAITGGKLTFVGASGELPLELNDKIRFDLSAMGRIGMLGGLIELGGYHTYFAQDLELNAGAGMTITNVGRFKSLARFGYQMSLTYDWFAPGAPDANGRTYKQDHLDLSHTLSISQILDTGFIASFTQDNDSVSPPIGTRTTLTRHIAMLGLVF